MSEQKHSDLPGQQPTGWRLSALSTEELNRVAEENKEEGCCGEGKELV